MIWIYGAAEFFDNLQNVINIRVHKNKTQGVQFYRLAPKELSETGKLVKIQYGPRHCNHLFTLLKTTGAIWEGARVERKSGDRP